VNGIEVGHGAAAAPDGSRLYVSNEAESTLDVVDGKTLRVISHVKLSGHSEQHLREQGRPARVRGDSQGARRR
jgi:YVTN family beta-propeller protein